MKKKQALCLHRIGLAHSCPLAKVPRKKHTANKPSDVFNHHKCFYFKSIQTTHYTFLKHNTYTYLLRHDWFYCALINNPRRCRFATTLLSSTKNPAQLNPSLDAFFLILTSLRILVPERDNGLPVVASSVTPSPLT